MVVDELNRRNQPWDQALLWASGQPGGLVGAGEGKGRARAAESSRKRMGLVARQTWVLIIICLFQLSDPG